ncbi:hypothetical protein [Streptomyces sp. NPDC020362]|uniref:hypothetical protein n=1 Tax=unclassified Streptomyces TaxID=2593676 RepID=UPI000A7D51C0
MDATLALAVAAAAVLVIGAVAPLAAVLASLPLAGTAAHIAWELVGCAVAALLGIGLDRPTTLLLRPLRAHPRARQKSSGKGQRS